MITDLELLEIAQDTATVAWRRFVNLYPKLRFPGYSMPVIQMNNRYKSTAGMCYAGERIIKLCTSMMRENVQHFKDIIIPHELAHQVAYDIYGDIGHGPNWKTIMQTFGIPADRCHNLTSSALESMRDNRQTNLIKRMAAEFVVGDTATFVHRNRQRIETNILGKVTKVNLKTIKLRAFDTGVEWTVPKDNTCNLRHA
jgi:predicted SprT family Zn-dependent metalloprotease